MIEVGRFRIGPWHLAAGLGGIVLLWMASGIFAAPDSQLAAEREGPAAAQRVEVISQSAEDFMRSVTVYGRTAPARTSIISAETSGRVTQIALARGERAASGAPLLALDRRDRDERLSTARAVVRQRQLEFEAQQDLARRSYISESTLAEAQANLEAARLELRRAELDIARMTVRAPFDGAVQERMVEVGDFVQPGDPILTFVDERSLIVTGTISEREIVGVSLGAIGTATLSSGEVVQGRVRYVAPVADPATRTFVVELEIANPEGRLRGGVTAELTLSAEHMRAHHIAASLLTLDEDGRLGLKLLDAGQHVRFVPVQIVGADDRGTWVTGPPDDATIIVVGQGWVRDGDPVTVGPQPVSDEG